MCIIGSKMLHVVIINDKIPYSDTRFTQPPLMTLVF